MQLMHPCPVQLVQKAKPEQASLLWISEPSVALTGHHCPPAGGHREEQLLAAGGEDTPTGPWALRRGCWEEHTVGLGLSLRGLGDGLRKQGFARLAAAKDQGNSVTGNLNKSYLQGRGLTL